MSTPHNALAKAGSSALVAHDRYLVRRKFWSFLGQKFFIYDGSDNLIGYVKQKAFKLKEDIRVYRTEACADELLVIKARSIIDFSAAYDVVDPTTQEKVGAFRRKGMASSFVRDTWEILDLQDRTVGTILEDSAILGMVRRYVFKFLPQAYTVTIGATPAAEFRQTWNIFIPKMWCNFQVPNATFDRRLGLGAAILISAIEGRQQ